MLPALRGSLPALILPLLALAPAARCQPTIQAQAQAQVQVPAPGSVRKATHISALDGGFTGALDFNDFFGIGVTAIGDLDGDGITDMAVGAIGDDDGGGPSDPDRGGVWILFLNADGSVKSHAKISHTEGDLGATLISDNWFGYGVERLDDFDGDGVFDLAVGASGDHDGGWSNGALYLLMLEPDGSVKSHTKINEVSGGFGGTLDISDDFGNTIANLGDLDGDGTIDLAVTAAFDDDGGFNAGAVWILFLNPDGTVKHEQKISNLAGSLCATLAAQNEFGRSVANLGDLDGDGIVDLAVGAYGDDDGFPEAGSVWILFLRQDGTVRACQKISALSGGFTGNLDAGSRFGASVANLGDLDGDGVNDLAVGASRGPFFAAGASRVFVLFMRSDGTVREHLEIGEGQGGFPAALPDGDRFGESLANLGDLDGDGRVELAVGANGDDDGAPDAGAVWVLSLHGSATAHWSYVTPGKPGPGGVPLLRAEGPLVAGGRGEMQLDGGPPGAPAWLLFGLAWEAMPFKGGVIIPQLDLVVGLPSLDAQGELELPFEWPAGVPSQLSFWLQIWLADPAASYGLSASNGVKGCTY